MLPLAFTQSASESYERLGHRIQQLISSPHVQKKQLIDVRPAPDESRADWERLLGELEETSGVLVQRLGEDTIRIEWKGYCE